MNVQRETASRDSSRPDGLPSLCVRGASPGPTLVVTANLHGDECVGIGVIHALLPVLERNLRAGAVHLFPSLNPEGLKHRSRRLPSDSRDLNRLFPGDPRGSPAERHADVIWKKLLAVRPTAVLDLHSDTHASIPYALVDRPVALPVDVADPMRRKLAGMAHATGLAVILEYPDPQYRTFHLDRSLTGCLVNKAGIPAITVETGPKLYLDPDATLTGLQAVSGVLAHLGMTEVSSRAPPPSAPSGAWRRDGGPRVTKEGILAPMARPGRILAKGDPIAEVRSLLGEVLERIPALGPCFVISLPEGAQVEHGDPVCSLAVPE